MKMLLSKICSALQAKCLQGNLEQQCQGGTMDSRNIRGGELFFAIHGEKTDGHNFLSQAAGSGAVGAIVEKSVLLSDYPDFVILQVADSKKALQDCARLTRTSFAGKVVAITGSNGKTTTKDMIAQVTAQKFPTAKTYANYNNELGLPLTIMNAPVDTEVMVLEMGMRGQGEITFLADIARPQIGVITNIGISHIELLKSQENIASAKFELINALGRDGIAILNADDPWCVKMARHDLQTITYGLKSTADVWADELKVDEQGTAFLVHYKETTYPAFLPTWGRHNITNALAAVAVAIALKMSITDALVGLKNYQSSAMRLEMKKTSMGATIIDDTYNANPVSVTASLEVLQAITSKRSVAVLGEMYELGDFQQEGHEKAGAAVVDNKIDILVTVGPIAEGIAKGAKSRGLAEEKIFSFKDNTAAGNFLCDFLLQGDTVLIKGSRGMHMENIVTMLTERIES